jgi:hypothetical protein
VGWSATGTIDGDATGVTEDGLNWSETEDEPFTDGEKLQIEFLHGLLADAYKASVIEGKYLATAGGHNDLTEGENARKDFNLTLSAIA